MLSEASKPGDVVTRARAPRQVRRGAPDRASPHFMGRASLGLDVGIFCDFLYSVLLLSAILGLDFLGLALSRPQVRRAVAAGAPRRGGAVARAVRARGSPFNQIQLSATERNRADRTQIYVL